MSITLSVVRPAEQLTVGGVVVIAIREWHEVAGAQVFGGGAPGAVLDPFASSAGSLEQRSAEAALRRGVALV